MLSYKLWSYYADFPTHQKHNQIGIFPSFSLLLERQITAQHEKRISAFLLYDI